MSDTPSTNVDTPAADTSDDLDQFSSDFFGQKKDTPVATTAEETDDKPDDNDAPSDAHSDVDDTDTGSDDDDAPTEGDEASKSKKKTRFQERIDELTAKAKEAERRAEAAEAKLKGQDPEPKPAPKAAPAVAELVEPTPTDENEDGSPKYELGEFDPQYIKDLTKFALKSEKAALEQEAAKADEIASMNAEKEALETSWSAKLPDAQERYPDFNEKGQALVATFDGINAAYGEFLSATLMSLDHGTDVLYYLANNVDEANKIVAAGPSRAGIMLGRLDARFDEDETPDDTTEKPVRKTSSAPTPPPQNKGTSVAKAQISDDTDDLDAFSRKLFDKRYGQRR